MSLYLAVPLGWDLWPFVLLSLGATSLIVLVLHLKQRLGAGWRSRTSASGLLVLPGRIEQGIGERRPAVVQEQNGDCWALPPLLLRDQRGRRWEVVPELGVLLGARRVRYQGRRLEWLADGDSIAVEGTPHVEAYGESSYRQPAARVRFVASRIMRQPWTGQRWLVRAAWAGLIGSLLGLVLLDLSDRYVEWELEVAPTQQNTDDILELLQVIKPGDMVPTVSRLGRPCPRYIFNTQLDCY